MRLSCMSVAFVDGFLVAPPRVRNAMGLGSGMPIRLQRGTALQVGNRMLKSASQAAQVSRWIENKLKVCSRVSP